MRNIITCCRPILPALFFTAVCFSISASPLFDLDSTLLSKSLFLDIDRAGEHFVAVGERGHIVASADGVQWQKIDSGTQATLTAVFFLDQDHGWAVGHDAVILKTSDGGYTWQQVYAAPEKEAPLLDVWFRDTDFGIAVGAYGLYLTTDDGGNTWQQEELNAAPAEDSDSEGENDLTELYDLHLNAITALDNGDLVIAAEAGRIYYSGNSGQLWQELPSPYNGSFFGVLPLGGGSFAVFGLRGHLYLTSDSGKNWQRIETQTRELLNMGIQLDDGTDIIVGMGGTLLVSHDNFATLKPVEVAGRNSFSGVTSDNERLILAGDHGIRLLQRDRLETVHE